MGLECNSQWSSRLKDFPAAFRYGGRMKLLPALVLGLGLISSNAAPPNVVFCIADDASPHFGVYGCTWVKTPNIDRVGKSGLVYDNAYTPTAKCAPSRASILTGRNPWLLEDAGNHQAYFPAKFKAFTEVLAEAGTTVGSFGKTWGPGEASHADGSPRDFALTASRGAGPGAAFAGFLASRPKDKPFFFWFGSKNPHRPYKLDAGIAAGKKTSDIDRVPTFWPDNDTVRRDMLDYATEVEAYDSEVGEVVAALEASGEAENTLIVITSDHGMPFPRSKGHNYDIANHVPLIVAWPHHISQPGRVADFVSFIDLAPTLLEVMGLDGEKSGMAKMTGTSFADLLQGKPQHQRQNVILGRERTDVFARPGSPTGLGYPIRALREGNLFYIHNFAPDRWPCGNPELGLLDTDNSPTKSLIQESGEKNEFWQFCYGFRPAEELYDLSKDADCIHNLAENSEYRQTAASMKDKLFGLLTAQDDPRMAGKGDLFDNYPCTKKPEGAPKAKKKRK